MDRKQLFDRIDQRQDELYDLLCRLIRINSENFGSHGNESECPAYIAELCRELGLETDLYSPLDLEGFTEHPDYMPGRHLEDRFNVTAVWKGAEDRNGLMLMGHSDTETIGDPNLWTVDPLGGLIRDGKIYGRGANDDKYAIAVSLFLIKLLKELGFQPKQNILMTAYCDEEQGGSHGALASALRYPSDCVINLDCDDFKIWNANSGGHLGAYRFRTDTTVDSCKRVADALPIVLEEMEKFGQRRRDELHANPFYAGTDIPEGALRYFTVRAGGNGNDLNIGEIRYSIYTDKTKEEIDVEYAALEAAVEARLKPLGLISEGFRGTTRFFPYNAIPADCPSILALQKAARETSGRELQVCGSCLSDTALLVKYNPGDVFAFGVGREFSVEGGAHQPDEFVECEALVELTKILGAFILDNLG